jgi:hypothetical protein
MYTPPKVSEHQGQKDDKGGIWLRIPGGSANRQQPKGREYTRDEINQIWMNRLYGKHMPHTQEYVGQGK